MSTQYTLDPTDRAAQVAIRAHLDILVRRAIMADQPALVGGDNVSPAIRDARAALRGMKEWVLVVSDGTQMVRVATQGTEWLTETDDVELLDMEEQPPLAVGVWLYEGNFVTEVFDGAYGLEYDTSFPGEYRRATLDDLAIMDLDPYMVLQDARDNFESWPEDDSALVAEIVAQFGPAATEGIA